jgi:tetratricopeptide (TPR) repeat protein
MDYLVYAHLQLGQDKQAREVIDEIISVTGFNPTVRGGPYAIAASPARYVLERGDWKGAAELQVRPSQFPYVDAITYFARALGAARSGNLESAKQDIATLAELRDKVRQAGDAYWAEQVDIQCQAATAWLLNVEGKHDEALSMASKAADTEDKTEKSPVTPGAVLPARELLGIMLLERGMAKEALAAFEATLKKEPRRLGATLGAAKAAEKAGETTKARQHYADVVALADGADPIRPEIAKAREFVARN